MKNDLIDIYYSEILPNKSFYIMFLIMWFFGAIFGYALGAM